MKLIIDIEDIDKKLLDKDLCGDARTEAILFAVKDGTPLDSVIEDIKKEITKEFINNPQVHFYGDAEESTANACLEIIDKHIGENDND